MTDLQALAKPFPSKFIHGNPSGGGSYVKHHTINQRLLVNVGPFDWELVQILRGFVPGRAPNPNGKSQRAKDGTPDLTDAIVGVVFRLTCVVDGRRTVIEEVGDCEEPHNWPHDGARLKDASSDALKRCAMRLGLGIHLWSQDEYFLDRALAQRSEDAGGDVVHNGSAVVAPPAPSHTAPPTPKPTEQLVQEAFPGAEVAS